MTPPRTIVHLDADAFFAAVEQASDTKLRDKPVADGYCLEAVYKNWQHRQSESLEIGGTSGTL